MKTTRRQLNWFSQQRRKRLMRRDIKHKVREMIAAANDIKRCPNYRRMTREFERGLSVAATGASTEAAAAACDKRSQFFGARCRWCTVRLGDTDGA